MGTVAATTKAHTGPSRHASRFTFVILIMIFRVAKHIPYLALGLSRAILTRNSAADINHVLSLPTTPITAVFDIIYHMVRALESQGELAPHLTHRVIGEVMSIYRWASRLLVLCQIKPSTGSVPSKLLEIKKTWKRAGKLHMTCAP